MLSPNITFTRFDSECLGEVRKTPIFGVKSFCSFTWALLHVLFVWSVGNSRFSRVFRPYSGSDLAHYQQCAKVSFILRHQGAQLILAYSWARPAILVAGKGRGGCFYFFCFFTFIPVPLSSLSLSFISSTISSIFFLPFSGRRHKMTHKGWRVVKPQLNQSTMFSNKKKKRHFKDNLQIILGYSIIPFPLNWHNIT